MSDPCANVPNSSLTLPNMSDAFANVPNSSLTLEVDRNKAKF